MRSFAVAALFASLALVSAQNTPTCALTCSTSTKTPCDSSDYKCLCTNQDAIAAVAKCIQSTCSAADVAAAQSASATLCQQIAGVSLSLPASLTETASGGSATGGASATTTGTGSAAGTSSAASTTPSSGAISNGVSVAAGVVALAFGVVAL